MELNMQTSSDSETMFILQAVSAFVKKKYRDSHSYLFSPNFDKYLCVHLFCEVSLFLVPVTYPQNYVFYWLYSDF